MAQDYFEHRGLTLLVASALIALSGRLSPCQTSSVGHSVTPPVTAATPSQIAAYEVATIKPWDETGFCMPLRIYIQMAFDIPFSVNGRVIGPDWIENAKYVIHGQPPDSIRAAMQTMTPDERRKEVELMDRSLLADRFHLKTHFETREMPTYQLVIANGGSKLKESPESVKMRAAVGTSMIKGTAITMHNFVGMLTGEADIGGREIVDKTALSGAYDLSLKWAPMGVQGVGNGTGAGETADSPSLFTAMEEQLGLKLMPVKGPVQVLVIEHIERPSEN